MILTNEDSETARPGIIAAKAEPTSGSRLHQLPAPTSYLHCIIGLAMHQSGVTARGYKVTRIRPQSSNSTVGLLFKKNSKGGS